MTASQLCRSENEPNATVIINDTRTEMTIQELGSQSKRRSDDYFDRMNEAEDESDDLNFEYDDEDMTSGTRKPEKQTKEQLMQDALLRAMKKPPIREQIGQVIPILRVMTPSQRLTLAALVSSQILSQDGLSEANLTQMASMFAGKNVENADDRHNITEHLLLPISMDIAKMFRGLGKEIGRNLRLDYPGPYSTVLRGSKPKRPSRPHFRQKMKLRPKPIPISANRRSDDIEASATSNTTEKTKEEEKQPVAEALIQPSAEDCEYFTNSLCLEVSNYPEEAIMNSIKGRQDILKTLLADFKMQSADVNVMGVTSLQEDKYQPTHYLSRTNRRQDGLNEIRDFGSEGGYMCPSSVKYARPKRARTTDGQWKYIVNTGDYTQTLRLEMCLKPLSSCSYVTNNFKSQCTQVFNYHRLLTWDDKNGLHMEIFKVPSCCSCHIQGYASLFPPNNEFTFAEKRKEPLSFKDYSPSDPAEHPAYNNIGGKREVPRPHQPTYLPPNPIVNQYRPNQEHSQNLLHNQYRPNPEQSPNHPPSHFRPNPEPSQNHPSSQYRPNPEPSQNLAQGQYRLHADPSQNLVDHLVPPGPPLPLDNERNNYDLHLDGSTYNKRGPIEHNRRYPKPTETARITNKVTDRIEIGQPPEGISFGSKVRLKRPNILPQHRPNVHNGQIPRIVLTPKAPQGTSPTFASTSNRYPNSPTNGNTQTQDIRTTKPTEKPLFVTPHPNNDLVIQPGSKPNPTQPMQYFNPDINEIKNSAKTPSFFVTPVHTKVVFEKDKETTYIPTTTTPKPPQKSETLTSSGQKRVNYNYHPIIDFFTEENTNKPAPLFAPPSPSHEWTPVVGKTGR